MTLDQVRPLVALGLSIIPLKAGSKEPEHEWKEFQSRRATEAELHSWFGNGVRRNAGIVLGGVSGVVVVESDTPEAEAWCAANLPATPMMTRSARGFHRYYLQPVFGEVPASIRTADGLAIEIKRRGQYCVGPGSVHPSGDVYTQVDPWPTSLDVVPFLPASVLTASDTAAPESAPPLPETLPDGSRNATLFREGCRLRRLGWQESEIAQALAAVNNSRCRPVLESAEVREIATSCARYAAAEDVFALTDTGNADFFASVHESYVRFDHARKCWFLFDGQHWQLDRTKHVDRLALESIRARQAAGLKIEDTARKAQHVKFAIQSESCRGRESLVRLATSLPTIAVSGDQWDTDPWLFAVQNGVIDLRSGAMRDGRPEDNITKVAPVAFDTTARCPRFDQFLREIFADEPELSYYLQRVVGYALTGLTTEQAFWIWFGDGANGKSTLLMTLMRCIFGDVYSWTMPFPSAGWSGSMSEYQKASLVGLRWVAASEVARRGELNEELIKSLTGGDTINARHPYGRPFTYTPVAKFVLLVNDKPIIRDQSHGMWRRVKLVAFNQKFSRPDTGLAASLAAEAPGILNWAVRGCLDWQRDGLRHPACVEAATASYRAESDPLLVFINECCVQKPEASVAAGELFKAYQRWCHDREMPAHDQMSQTAFGLRMKQLFTAETKGKNKVMTYSGVGLLTTEHDDAVPAF